MIKDIVPTPMEPFTALEEAALDERLAGLSVMDLRKYIDSARASLGNRALAATWRPRIEFGMRQAESALVKGEAAAALALAQAPPVVAAPAVDDDDDAPVKPKAKPRAKKAAAAVVAAE